MQAGAKENRYLDSRAFCHVIGRNAAQDGMVFGRGSAKLEFADIDSFALWQFGEPGFVPNQ